MNGGEEPSWPVFMASSMSRAAPSRTSPTMMRSGRIRSEFPDELADRDGPPTLDVGRARLQPQHVVLVKLELCGVLDRDDALVPGRNRLRTLRVVVFPEPVPPEMMMLRRPRTQASKVSELERHGAEGDQVTIGEGSAANFGWLAATHPGRSGKNGVHARSIRQTRVDHRTGLIDALPTRDTILSIVPQMRVVEKRASTGKILPSRSMKMSSGPLTMISVTSWRSRRKGSRGPWPRMSSETSWAMRVRSASESGSAPSR